MFISFRESKDASRGAMMPKSLKLCLFTMMYFGKFQASAHDEQKKVVNHRVLLILARGRRKEKENPLEDGGGNAG